MVTSGFAIEMGEYFTNKTLLRMKRVLYGDTTGLDRSEDAAVGSGVFKYCILESYDEALNNLEIKQTDQQASLLEEDDNLREQYVLSYMLDVESRGSQSLLNVESFRNPDEYKLKVERERRDATGQRRFGRDVQLAVGTDCQAYRRDSRRESGGRHQPRGGPSSRPVA